MFESTLEVAFDVSRHTMRVDAPWWVVANDRFMSGWGSAPGRSIVAIPCPTLAWAERVSWEMERSRSEMKYVSVRRGPTFKEAVAGRRLGHRDHLAIYELSPRWAGTPPHTDAAIEEAWEAVE